MNSFNKIENIALKIRRSPLLQNLPIWKITREIYQLFLRVTTVNKGLSRQLYPDLFFKVSYEGFELFVLKGAKETLLKYRDTIKVICETHTFMWKNSDEDLQIINFVSDLGLSIFKLTTASAPDYIPDSSHCGEKVTRIQDYGHYVIAKKFD